MSSNKSPRGVLPKTKEQIPIDGVYFRAPGVSSSLRAFSTDGPVNCYRDSFVQPDAVTNSIPRRVNIPKEFRSWHTKHENYNPPSYITVDTLSNCRNRNPKGWADPEPSISVNDPSYKHLFKPCNPIWYKGLSRDSNGNYLHPYGRIGIKGQGTLGGRHINEAIDPVTVYLDVDTGIVTVLLIKRNATDVNECTWAVPGGMVDFKPDSGNYTLPRALSSAYTSMQLMFKPDLRDSAAAVESENNLKENALRELNEETGFSGASVYQKLIAQMYSDDVRNTDTTWIVTTLFLIVPERCEAVQGDGAETSVAAWVPIQEAMGYEFFASHRFIVIHTLRYYVTHSFRDRNMQGSPGHRMAYDYLKVIPEMELPETFELLFSLPTDAVDSFSNEKTKSKSCSVS